MTHAQRKEEFTDQADDRGMIEAIDKAIEGAMRLAALDPWTQIAIAGDTFEMRRIENNIDNQVEFRELRVAPLEGLHNHARTPIHEYQYLAGKRFEMDYNMAMIAPMGAVDYEAASLYATDAVMKFKGVHDGIAGSAPPKTVKSNPSDAKLDAMKRLGDLHKRIGGRSYWLAEKVIGEEWPITRVAQKLGKHERYINGRFREALDDLAQHYGLARSR